MRRRKRVEMGRVPLSCPTQRMEVKHFSRKFTCVQDPQKRKKKKEIEWHAEQR